MGRFVVIGAGPAGLTAAERLLEDFPQSEVIVLEADCCVGGISRTVNYDGNRMDIGGHRFFSKNRDVVEFWKRHMPLQGHPAYDDVVCGRKKTFPEEGPDPEKTDNVMLLRDRFSRIYYLKKFFDYPMSMKKETFLNMGLGRTLSAGFSYLKSAVSKREEKSLEDFFINRFGRVLYGMFFENYTEKLWGRHPSAISADWGEQRVKGLSVFAMVRNLFVKDGKKETSLIESFWYPKYGPGHFWETVADSVREKGGKILYGHNVVAIRTEGDRIVSVACSVDGREEEIRGDVFLSSMPLKDLVLGLQGCPENIREIASGLPYLDFRTVGVLLKRLKLKNDTSYGTVNGIVPDCWIYVQEPDVKMLRLQVFNNWSPYMVKDVGNTVWVGLEYTCLEGDRYWEMSDDDFASFAVGEMEKIGLADKEDVLGFRCVKMKKAYPAYFDSYGRIGEIIDYLDRYGNLYCIGRNGQHRYNNMDHSMLTAMLAVDNIRDGIADKGRIWSVNAEKEYHESAGGNG